MTTPQKNAKSLFEALRAEHELGIREERPGLDCPASRALKTLSEDASPRLPRNALR